MRRRRRPARLREAGPLAPSSLGLVTTSHALVQEVLRSESFDVGWDRSGAPKPIRWALEYGDELDATGVAEPPSMLVVDPSDHTRYSRLVSRAFTPRTIAGFEPMIRRTADALLDGLEARVAADGGGGPRRRLRRPAAGAGHHRPARGSRRAPR